MRDFVGDGLTGGSTVHIEGMGQNQPTLTLGSACCDFLHQGFMLLSYSLPGSLQGKLLTGNSESLLQQWIGQQMQHMLGQISGIVWILQDQCINALRQLSSNATVVRA